MQTVAILRDPVGFLERNERRHGPIFRVKLIGFPRFVYVGAPAMAREVYATDRTVGRAAPGRKDFLEPLVGEHSLLCLEGEEWLRHRKLLGPAFHRRQVDDYRDEIARLTRAVLDDLPTGEPVALRPHMQRITLEVILRLVFGVTDEERLERLRVLLPELVEAGSSPLIWVAPKWLMRRPRRVPPLARFTSLRSEVDALVYEEIAERRAGGAEGRTDVLSRMLGAREEGERPLSDAELRDELVTLLVAGHETTATALAWTFERLVRAPHALARLEEGDDEYLRAVVKEALRARAVVIDTPRLLDGPVTIGDHEIPAGWYVSPAIPLVQRAPGDEFRPERFLEEGAGREAWIPFGGGKRHCVGSHLALLELEVVTREVVDAFALEAVDPAPEPAKMQHVTLVPADLGLVRARRRVPATTLAR